MNESTFLMLIVSCLILVYFLYNFNFQSRLNKNKSIDEGFKKKYKRLIWLLPILGPVIVTNAMNNQSKNKQQLSSKQKAEKTHFHESGKGIWGP
jgi:sorbitol-specific phosphotransferase system component IIC